MTVYNEKQGENIIQFFQIFMEEPFTKPQEFGEDSLEVISDFMKNSCNTEADKKIALANAILKRSLGHKPPAGRRAFLMLNKEVTYEFIGTEPMILIIDCDTERNRKNIWFSSGVGRELSVPDLFRLIRIKKFLPVGNLFNKLFEVGKDFEASKNS